MKNLFKDCEAELRATACIIAIVLSLVFALICIVQVISYYQAGIVANAWRRQGINLTQWEVFMGAEPVCPHCYQGDTK